MSEVVETPEQIAAGERVRLAGEAFVRRNSDYVVSPLNFKKIANWILTNKPEEQEATLEIFEKAWRALCADPDSGVERKLFDTVEESAAPEETPIVEEPVVIDAAAQAKIDAEDEKLSAEEFRLNSTAYHAFTLWSEGACNMSTLRNAVERQRTLAEIKKDELAPVEAAAAERTRLYNERAKENRKLYLEHANEQAFGHLRKEYGEANPLLHLNAASEFMQGEPRYHQSKPNAAALTKVIELNELYPSAYNYAQVFLVLDEAGLLTRAPKSKAESAEVVEPKPIFTDTPDLKRVEPDVPGESSADFAKRMGLRKYTRY